MKILSFGEILFDIIEREYHLGGAPLNFAAHVAQCGQESYILSRVGMDKWGQEAFRQIEALGVKTSLIKMDKVHPTGTVTVTLRYGQPDYTIHENAAYDFIDVKEHEELLDSINFDVLYFGTLAQRSVYSASALKELIARKKFPHIFYDINLRKNSYNETIVRDSLNLCTMLKLNDEEVHALSQMLYHKQLDLKVFLERLEQEFDIQTIIVTAGDKGCYVYQRKALDFVKGYPVQVLDTIGAGDSFSAAFVYYYFKENNGMKAAEVANKLGSYVAGSKGAIPIYSPEIKNVLGIDSSVNSR